MKYTIDKTSSVAAYLQLYRQIRDDIVGGMYGYGTKLPSKRVICEETGISVVTAEHAYALLCDEGYVESRERSGYFVIFRTDDGFAVPSTLEYARRGFKNESGQSAEFPFSVLSKTMRSVMNDYGETILDRSPSFGRDEFREAIRQYLARSRGVFADREQIIIGSGSEYLYSLIVEFFGRERVYAIESPSYKKIEEVYRAADVRYEMLALGHDGIESAELHKTNADVLHISPYRSFPSGVSASASKRHEYLRFASASGRYIIEDDFESEFSVSKKPEETLFSHTDSDNVIYMNTFSKTVSPSLRTAYMVLPKSIAAQFEEKLGFYSCTVPTFVQFVLARLITNGDFERHINRVRRKKRREMLGE